MTDIAQIPLPVPYLGSVNLWLLRGDPLTLVDAGPNKAEALAALEDGLSQHGLAVEDAELLLITHHHLDHSGLAATIKERSGARIAALDVTAAWGFHYHERVAKERRFTEALMREHGVPEQLIAAAGPFFEHIVRDSAPYETDVVLADGDEIRAGGRTLRVIHRPGHSATDTLLVDEAADVAFVGDHLLADITSGAEVVSKELAGDERRRSLLEYLRNLRLTAAMPLRTCYTGHGPPIVEHRQLIEERYAFHSDRLNRIAEHVSAGCSTAFEVARKLWSDEVAQTQPVLTIWEVVGHLDVLVERGTVREEVDDDGRHLLHSTKVDAVAAKR